MSHWPDLSLLWKQKYLFYSGPACVLAELYDQFLRNVPCCIFKLQLFLAHGVNLKCLVSDPTIVLPEKCGFSSFSPPSTRFTWGVAMSSPGVCLSPGCQQLPRGRGPTALRCHEGGMHQSCPAHQDNPCPCTGLPSSKLKPAPLRTPSRLVQASCDVPGRQCHRGKVLACPCRGRSRRCPKPGGSVPAARRQVPAVLAAPHARARLLNLSHPHLPFGRK